MTRCDAASEVELGFGSGEALERGRPPPAVLALLALLVLLGLLGLLTLPECPLFTYATQHCQPTLIVSGC